MPCTTHLSVPITLFREEVCPEDGARGMPAQAHSECEQLLRDDARTGGGPEQAMAFGDPGMGIPANALNSGAPHKA